MSPFTQLSSALTPPFSSSAIDRNFSPLLSYIDEFDRHFSHRHRFMNCFIPRFDLEEDEKHYYLFGELPGAKVEDVVVEVWGGNRLVVSGKTWRGRVSAEGDMKGNEEVLVKDGEINVDGNGNEQVGTTGQNGEEIISDTTPLQEHRLHHTNGTIHNVENNYQPSFQPPMQATNHILLSERLVGEFNRTFAFPSPIIEQGIRASMEDGVLKLMVPKQVVGLKERMGRKVEISKAGWNGNK